MKQEEEWNITHDGGLEVNRKNVQLAIMCLFNTSEMWLWYYVTISSMLASLGSYSFAYA